MCAIVFDSKLDVGATEFETIDSCSVVLIMWTWIACQNAFNCFPLAFSEIVLLADRFLDDDLKVVGLHFCGPT